MNHLIFILLFIFNLNASWKFRAREHFDWHSISYQGVSNQFSGFSNTINFWHEVPFNYSLGLAFNPLLGSARSNSDSGLMSLGSRVVIYNLNCEFKFFPIENKNFFSRFGMGASLFSSQIVNEIYGGNIYAGVGYELKIWRVYVAPELAFRYMRGESSMHISTITPSVGVHFYEDSFF